MTEPEKMPGEQRRLYIVNLLMQATKPMTGRELGELTNVSRQVIVGDISLLKAKKEPILATSQGYVYVKPIHQHYVEKTIVCRHSAEQTKEELTILVDHGITVKDVRIEHPVYGDLSASIMVSNRREVEQFIQQIEQAKAGYLSHLAEGGIHIHTVSAEDERLIEEAEEALKKAGILVV